jgi:RNA-directed DNA polymerase
VPQGGPLSPLLVNVVLHELDCELERRGHIFVRNADDFINLLRHLHARERVLATSSDFVSEPINRLPLEPLD